MNDFDICNFVNINSSFRSWACRRCFKFDVVTTSYLPVAFPARLITFANHLILFFINELDIIIFLSFGKSIESVAFLSKLSFVSVFLGMLWFSSKSSSSSDSFSLCVVLLIEGFWLGSAAGLISCIGCVVTSGSVLLLESFTVIC